jgi:hypothetical protein
VRGLSAEDMLARREQYLSAIAAAVGLEAPTDLQRVCYDTFLNYYLLMAVVHDLGSRVLPEVLLQSRRLAIWNLDEIIQRLEADEQLEGWTLDRATGKVGYDFEFNLTLPPDTPEKSELMDTAQQLLRHGLSYETRDGIATLNASFTYRLGQTAKSPVPVQARALMERIRQEAQDATVTWPAVVSRRDGSVLTPEEMAEEQLKQRGGWQQSLQEKPWNAQLALAILHETAELGLVDRYIGSPDRRWLCDGTANWVAWRVARDLGNPEIAEEVYSLSQQLQQAKQQQKRIRLTAWKAVENLSEEERGTAFDQAHYPFATRVLFALADRHGEQFISEWWREIGKTPRQKVTMKTVEAAYRKLTRQRLGPVIAEAERLPVGPN